MTAHVRVNFHLSQELATFWESAARSERVTKATLLRSWIARGDTATLAKYWDTRPNHKGQTVDTDFNFRLKLEDKVRLTEFASSKSSSLSKVLRAIVELGLKSTQTRVVTKVSQLEDRYRLPTSKLVELAHQYIELGQLELACELFDEAETRLISRDRDDLVFAWIDAGRGIVARHRRDLVLAQKLLQNALTISNSHGDNLLSAQIWCELGTLAEIRDDWESAIHATKASWHLIHQQDPKQQIAYHLRLAALYANQLDQNQVGEYRKQLEHLLETGELSGFTKWQIANRLTVSALRLQQPQTAGEWLRSAERFSGQSNSIKELRYWHENAGAYHLARQNLALAQSHLHQAWMLEEAFRNKPQFSKSKLLWWHIEAERDFKPAINQIAEMVEYQHQPTYRLFGKYILAATGYLYAESIGHQRLASNQLKHLADTAELKAISQAAAHTLNTSKLRVLI